MTSTIETGVTADEYADKLFHATIAAFETLSTYVGVKLGLYQGLLDLQADSGPATAGELAAHTKTAERYCLEWLEMQASYGTLTVVDAGGDRRSRRFRLPPGPAEVLTDEHSLSYLGALPAIVAAAGRQIDPLLGAYQNGGGVGWSDFGDDMRKAQAALNRPLFESQLAPALQGCDDIAALLAGPDVRIADVGCGGGWSTIALAAAYPDAVVVGLDVDPPSVAMARAAASSAGVADRVTFELVSGTSLAAHGEFDAVFAFECLHDMPQPVAVLDAMRRALRPGGAVVIMDEAVADEFQAPGDDVDQLMYGFSLFVCLPDGLSSAPSAGTGTVFRRPVLEQYAHEAGFRSVSVLPIEDFGFFRFYRLNA